MTTNQADGDSRESAGTTRTCYRCGSRIEEGAGWCGTCGAEQDTACRHCGEVFPKALGRCPSCGTRRIRTKRGRKKLRRFLKEDLPAWLHDHRRMILYIGGGFLAGIIGGSILKALSDSEGGPQYVWNQPMYWIEPFLTAGRTILRALWTAVSAVASWLVNLVLMHFKTTIFGILGALAGLVLALRRGRSRRKVSRRRGTRKAG